MKTYPIVILAAGANTRMFPLNFDNHKGLLPLLGESLLERTVRELDHAGYENLIIVGSERDFELIEKTIPDVKAKVELVIQPEARGMGDALLQAKSLLPEKFFVISPYHFSIATVLEQMANMPQQTVVCSTATDTPWEYGIFAFQGNRPISLVEKPSKEEAPSDQKIQTIYLLNQEFITLLSSVPADEYNFEVALNELLKKTEVGIVKLETALPSLKYAWHLFDFQFILFNQLKSFTATTAKIDPTAVIDESLGPVWIGEHAQIGHHSRIVGPAYIGNGVIVGDFVLIRQSSVETGSTIGAFTELARCIVMEKSSMHHAYLGDSIIGSHVRLGAGFITANKRFDRHEVSVEIKGQKIDSQRRGLGVIIGNRAATGIGVRTMPGVCIGAEANVYPNTVVYKSVSHQQVVKE